MSTCLHQYDLRVFAIGKTEYRQRALLSLLRMVGTPKTDVRQSPCGRISVVTKTHHFSKRKLFLKLIFDCPIFYLTLCHTYEVYLIN